MSRAGCFPTAIFRAVDASQGLIDFIGALGGIRTPDPQNSKLCAPGLSKSLAIQKTAVSAGYSTHFKGIFIDTERL